MQRILVAWDKISTISKMPAFTMDCLFKTQRWSALENGWVTHCSSSDDKNSQSERYTRPTVRAFMLCWAAQSCPIPETTLLTAAHTQWLVNWEYKGLAQAGTTLKGHMYSRTLHGVSQVFVGSASQQNFFLFSILLLTPFPPSHPQRLILTEYLLTKLHLNISFQRSQPARLRAKRDEN